MKKNYAKNYSQLVPKILNEQHRLRIATQIMGVLHAYLGETRKLSCLDVGCSNGIITNYLAKYFYMVTGIDVDSMAIKNARSSSKTKNVSFFEMSAERTSFKDKSFDIVVCNQTYEFVNNQDALVVEIFRILKPGGVCFLGAHNRLTFLESQSGLPLLHFLPERIANIIASFFNKIYYPANYLTLWDLRKLFKKFIIHDMTILILKNPQKYCYYSLSKYSFFIKFLPVQLIYPILPNYIWILEKP